jgi:hypothetical protein
LAEAEEGVLIEVDVAGEQVQAGESGFGDACLVVLRAGGEDMVELMGGDAAESASKGGGRGLGVSDFDVGNDVVAVDVDQGQDAAFDGVRAAERGTGVDTADRLAGADAGQAHDDGAMAVVDGMGLSGFAPGERHAGGGEEPASFAPEFTHNRVWRALRSGEQDGKLEIAGR